MGRPASGASGRDDCSHDQPGDHGGSHANPVSRSEAGQDEGVGLARVRRWEGSLGERPCGPGSRVDRGVDLGRAHGRLGGGYFAHRSRGGTDVPAPPTRVLRRSQQGRHDQLADDRCGAGGLAIGNRLDGIDRQSGVWEVLEGRWERRLPVALRIRGPPRSPRFRDRAGRIGMLGGQPDEGPRPGHHAVGVVATPAGRQPATASPSMGDRIDQARRLAHRRRRDAQVRERIPGVGVGPVLRNDKIRPEGGREPRKDPFDRTEPGILASVWIERQVDGRPGGLAFPELVDEAGAGEQGHT